MHRGNDLFGSGHAALDALKRKRRRLKSTTPLRAAVDMVLDRAQLQSSSVAPSEVSLAIRPRKDYPPAPDIPGDDTAMDGSADRCLVWPPAIAEELDSLLVKEPQLRVLL